MTRISDLFSRRGFNTWDIDRERIIEREHALIKLEVPADDRAQLLQLIAARVGTVPRGGFFELITDHH
jgi:acetolactate synthase small subunit